MEFEVVESMEALRQLYDQPMDLVLKKQKNTLDEYTAQFLSLSAFCVLSTSGANANMDCSPRGDYPGFIHVLNDRTLLIPDRPGNNRLDSLSNIIENPNVGLLVLIPGFKECLRINGAAKIVTNTDILTLLEYKGKKPKAAIVLSINEIYFHCAKAITRSKLWDEASKVERNIMPSLGRILMAQTDPTKTDADVKIVEAMIEKRVKTTLY